MKRMKLLLIPLAAAGSIAAQTGSNSGAVVAVNPQSTARQDFVFTAKSGAAGIVTREFSIMGKPVTGQPYSAEEVTESVQTLADGNRIVNSTTTRVYRDTQGRVRREVTPATTGENAQAPTFITISDPVAGVSYSLDPQTKTARKMPAPNIMKVTTGSAPTLAPMLPPPMPPVQIRDQPAVAGPGPFFFATFSSNATNSNTTRQDLGSQEIDGVAAKGTRETTVIPAETIGNERPITITSEHWFSPDLQIDLKSMRDDPRMGQVSVTVTDLTRAEPDASLFQVPSDYKIEEGKFQRAIESQKVK